jgi:hypothetical protein
MFMGDMTRANGVNQLITRGCSPYGRFIAMGGREIPEENGHANGKIIEYNRGYQLSDSPKSLEHFIEEKHVDLSQT